MLDVLPGERIEHYQPYHAVRAHCLTLVRRREQARSHATRAIQLSKDPNVRAWLLDTYLRDSSRPN